MIGVRATRSPLESARRAITGAEASLREAASKAAASGAYADVVVITRWAQALQRMAGEDQPETEVIPVEPTAQHGDSANGAEAPRRMKSKPHNGSITAGTVIYSRESDVLMKTARSRKSRTAYEHKASFDTVMTVAECLSEWRANRKLLTADQLLEAYSKRKGSVVSYQLYVVLGWLVQTGLVRRHGRTGYSVPSPTTVVEDVRKAWTELAGTTN